MMKWLKKVWDLLKATAKHWLADNSPRMGAALAYYGVLALPAILVILLFVVSLFYHSKNTSSQMAQEINSFLGQKSGQFIQSMMSDSQIHGKGPVATGIAIVILIISATGVFGELQSDLNSAWGVELRADVGWKRMIVDRVLSFLLLITIGVLLVVSLLASAALASFQGSAADLLPGGKQLWHVVEFVISCGIITVLFALIFKFLPNARAHWRDVWVGSLFTAFLFNVGKMLLGLYLGYGSVGSMFGVAGSIVLILVWVYYSAQIFLFGAEFTQAYANLHGRAIKPSREALWKAEGQGANEDREEAQTNGKPEKTEWKPSSGPQREDAAVHELADRVHGWRTLRNKKT
jgi:membrane protein